jgi:hypothetical protein
MSSDPNLRSVEEKFNQFTLWSDSTMQALDANIRKLERAVSAGQERLKQCQDEVKRRNKEARRHLRHKIAIKWGEFRDTDRSNDVVHDTLDEMGQWLALEDGVLSKRWYSTAELDDPVTIAFRIGWGLDYEEMILYDKSYR